MSEKKPAKKKQTKDTRPPVGAARSALSIGPREMPLSGSEADAFNVVYIHGIGDQPKAPDLKLYWDLALFGRETSRTVLAYWADLRMHGTKGARRIRDFDPAAMPEDEARILEAFQRGRSPAPGAGSRVFPPFLQFIGQPIMNIVTRLAARDAYDYFHDADFKKRLQQRLIQALEAQAAKPILLIAHSLGSVIAFDTLAGLVNRQLPSKTPLTVARFITIGSPLGIDEIQHRLAKPSDRLKVPSSVLDWRNFADPLDFVALDKSLWREFEGPPDILNERVHNQTSPHSAIDYLSSEPVQAAVNSMLGRNALLFGARIRRDTLKAVLSRAAADEFLAAWSADGSAGRQTRHPVLIEARDPAGWGASASLGTLAPVGTLQANKMCILDGLKKLLGKDHPAARVDELRRFIAARLTVRELAQIEHELHAQVYCVWANAKKKALIHRSGATVHVTAARNAYNAFGQGVRWAVLDTGIASGHPHFQGSAGSLIEEVWDCTQAGRPVASPRRNGRLADTSDVSGHGTHVAGIITGRVPDSGFSGMAPQASLQIFKVLNDSGQGDDAWIIKALDLIAEMNEQSSALAVHGVNLSLGGPYDASAYGVGHSPVCQELERLWRQGVVVCVAAGNEGAFDVVTPVGPSVTLYPSLTIGDPANLESCIAVGSVHTERPHSYGVSYFSSRGPTADGRAKPDVVAPGENISSCNAQFTQGANKGDLFVTKSGTSMACPHISGLIAAFLSVRKEFIGRPDAIKAILKDNCTDIGRDRYHQGAGVPNLIKMLANT